MMKLEQCRYRHTWRADRCHTGAGDVVQHPCSDCRDHAGHGLNMNNLPGGALFTVVSPDAVLIERVPPVMNLNFLTDMGRNDRAITSAAAISTRHGFIGRKNWLFAGSDRGGEQAASMYTLIATAKLNNIDPQAWLADVLRRIADHPARRLHELLPWNWHAPTTEHAAAA
jgi:hypothetical protein